MKNPDILAFPAEYATHHPPVTEVWCSKLVGKNREGRMVMGTHILGTNHEELSSRVCSFMKLNTKYGFSSEYYEHVDNMATQYHVQKDANVAIANACYSENIASHPDGWARYFELES